MIRVMCEFCVVEWVIERRVHDARTQNTCAARSTSDAPTTGLAARTGDDITGPPHPVQPLDITTIRPSQ